ncbi:MAG: preprotein translocase subunit YajC [Planctomycetaceae bacterium]|jgi:preprotein translocase subunit YajC|nr:preprotein translocase subunit YajC [Planctomycetaceae bacterium]
MNLQMNVIFSEIYMIFAQADQAQQASPQGINQVIPMFIIFGLIGVMLWFFVIRPQQRQEEAARKLIESLKQNDKVYTVGGMVGIIHSVDKEKNEVVLKVDESNGTKIRFVIHAIQGKIDKDQKNN